jgi:AcrR family transcriptional regulator/DNA-binding MarR family transcriptional regulator
VSQAGPKFGRPISLRKRAGRTNLSGSAPRGREGVAEIQRQRIVTALGEVAGERGIADVTVAHIVARSGVSRRTFYELFSDREACFLAAFDHAVELGAARVLPVFEEANGWCDEVRAGLTALLQCIGDEPVLTALVVVDSLGAGTRALERRTHLLEILITVIDRGRSEVKTGHDPPPLTAEGVVGAVVSVIHTRLLEGRSRRLLGLRGELMSMIVLPYLGAAAARRELALPAPKASRARRARRRDPLQDLDMRLTYRTVRVLTAIAANPGASNRQVANTAGIIDQGQMSKLLARLEGLGLIHNAGPGHLKGEANAWTLTTKGTEVEQTIRAQTERTAS